MDDEAAQHHEKYAAVSDEDIGHEVPLKTEGNLLEHEHGAVPRFAAKPRAGEGDEDERDEDANGAVVPLAAVFPRADFLPEFVHYESESVQSAPDHKVPTGAMPQPAYEHGEHEVHVGTHPCAEGRQHLADDVKQTSHCHKAHGHPPASRHQRHKCDNYPDHDIGKERTGAVAAHRYVEVIFEPTGERNVPTLPEFAHISGFIR